MSYEVAGGIVSKQGYLYSVSIGKSMTILEPTDSQGRVVDGLNSSFEERSTEFLFTFEWSQLIDDQYSQSVDEATYLRQELGCEVLLRVAELYLSDVIDVQVGVLFLFMDVYFGCNGGRKQVNKVNIRCTMTVA